jgi:uncharacterized protein YndB with AHSA1/START domain
MQQPPAIVWEYLTNSELISQWLMKNDFKPVVGHRFTFHAGPVPAMQFDGRVHCEVLEIDPEKKLVYSWKFGPEPGKIILDTIVTWTLVARDRGTVLSLVHTGFRDPDHEYAFQVMSKGWDDNVQKIMQYRNVKN